MPTRSKPLAKFGMPSTSTVLYVDARVHLIGSTSIYEITRVSYDGATVDIRLIHTNIERFRVPASILNFVQ